MGRPERSLDVGSGPVAKFAWDLRALRKAAGSPSYRNLAGRANYSATVLSRAASGRELASLPVVLAYVKACGGDCDDWRERWLKLAAPPGGEGTGAGAADGLAGEEAADLAGRVRLSMGRLLGPGRLAVQPRHLVLAAVIAIAMLATAAVTAAIMSSFTAQPSRDKQGRLPLAHSLRPGAPTQAALSDGNDPAESGCASGAVTVAHADLRLMRAAGIRGARRRPGTVAGVVELRYAARCHAAWARVIPSPAFDLAPSGRAGVRITRPSDGTSASFTANAMITVYGDLLLTRHGCLTASGTMEFKGGSSASAVTPCWKEP
jgi:Protein of unknown function (DUF2690)/Helix-turn-helix domain